MSSRRIHGVNCVCVDPNAYPLDMSIDGSFEASSSLPRKRQCRRSDQPNDDSVLNNESDKENQDADSVPIASFSDRLGAEVVSIYAGPSEQQKHFTVHKTLLCSTATYFSTMFQGSFAEASSGAAHFPEDSPEAWELFIQWLYIGRLPPLIQTAHRDRNEAAALDKRIQLYCLAETYNIVALMDSTIDTIASAYKIRTRTPDISSFRYAYTHTSEASPLRALLSRWFYHLLITRDDVTVRPTRYSTETMWQVATEHPDLLHDLFTLMRGQQGAVPKAVLDPSEIPLCTYHQHTLAGESKCVDKRPMSDEASKLLKIMSDTFPNSRKRFTVESLARRLALDRKSTLALVDELQELRKVTWVSNGPTPSETFLQCA